MYARHGEEMSDCRSRSAAEWPREFGSYPGPMAGGIAIHPGKSRPGGDDLDLDQELGSHELGNDEEHRSGSRVAEETRSHLPVGRDVFGTRQVLGDLDHVGDRHAGSLKDADDMLPGDARPGPRCPSGGRRSTRGRACRPSAAIAGSAGFDRVAIGTDLAGNADVMDGVRHLLLLAPLIEKEECLEPPVFLLDEAYRPPARSPCRASVPNRRRSLPASREHATRLAGPAGSPSPFFSDQPWWSCPMALTIARQVVSHSRQALTHDFISAESNLSHSVAHALHASEHARQAWTMSGL